VSGRTQAPPVPSPPAAGPAEGHVSVSSLQEADGRALAAEPVSLAYSVGVTVDVLGHGIVGIAGTGKGKHPT
jgi:hypothetical protein